MLQLEVSQTEYQAKRGLNGMKLAEDGSGIGGGRVGDAVNTYSQKSKIVKQYGLYIQRASEDVFTRWPSSVTLRHMGTSPFFSHLNNREQRLSNDVALIQWITSCHKNRMNLRVTTLWHVHVTPLTTPVPTVRFLNKIMLVLK